MKKLPYKEGDVFAVPLLDKRFALGVVARSPRLGKVLLGYFFRYGKTQLPRVGAIPDLKSQDAVLAVIFGDLGLYRGDWPIVGRVQNWRRDSWPMPSFIRREPLTGAAWKVTYSEDDPSQEVEIVRLHNTGSALNLERDSLRGTESLRATLTKLLA